MKTTLNFSKTFIAILVATCLLLSCSKDGEQGAIGPQGPQGEQGPAGAQGEAGEDGAIGTANVIYSDWMVSEFDANIIATGSGYMVDAPDLTQEIIDSGVILGFGKNIPLVGSPDVFQLPFISSSNQYYLTAQDPLELRISVSSIDGTSVGTTLFEEYRYVLIPGGASASGKSSIDYTNMTYDEIVDRFNIPE